MLNQQLQPDEVLGVAFQYTYNGQIYQVGEFAGDIPPDPNTANVLFLKMLKSTAARPKLPIWQLMMKNVYSLGAFGISPQDFRLDIVYLDPGGGERRFIPAEPLNTLPLIRWLGLDRLNNQNDPQPDGVFDFIPGITINPQNGKVIFPVVEPFGRDLTKVFGNSPEAKKYVYQVLYDSTKFVALQYPEFNRFTLKGTYRASSSSDISLGAFNIPQGSVSVTAGGRILQENLDYTIDYNLGRIKIINTGILNSGVPINVKFENNPAFSFLRKTLFASRFDYFINDRFKLGGTFMRLSERPFTQKLNINEDPIANKIIGLDANYQTEAPWLTRMIDKIPLIDTKDKSTITFTAEGAKLIPGHSKAIGDEGIVYIDDFEGTQTTYDLRFPFFNWAMASTPTLPKFLPEASLVNDLSYGFKRAKLQWYNIDPFFYTNNAPTGIKGNKQEQYGFYTRQMFETDIFPGRPNINPNGLPPILTTFDLRYDPRKRGPYNFRTNGIDPNTGFLLNPIENWGGIMRSIDFNDFENANIEFIQFWILDPFLDGVPQGQIGDLYVQLGNVSEDILKDSRLFFENSLPPNGDKSNMDETVWSYLLKQGLPPVANAFDNNPTARQYQDVGYDGATLTEEQTRYNDYLNIMQSTISGALYQNILSDPSNDNYRYYRDPSYDNIQAGILDRYQDFNNPDGNSPISQGNQSLSFASTFTPESEDLNRDLTLNETEAYFEYKLSLNPALLTQGQNFITNIVETPAKDGDGNPIGNMRWLQVRIPISDYIRRTGGIQDFRSIRFIRIFLTGFEEPIVLRFGRLELLRNQWRRFKLSLTSPGEYLPDDNSSSTFFNVSSVSFEENSSKQPVNYVIPPGIQRQQLVGTVTNFLQNEQALQLKVCDLQDGDARASFKNLNLDVRYYEKLELFVHAESVIGQQPIQDNQMTAFIRLGSDFNNNYYEYEIPLKITPPGTYNKDSDADRLKVWPAENNFVIMLRELATLKQQRNQAGFPLNLPYAIINGDVRVTIVGNPDLGVLRVAMLGLRNPQKGTWPNADDSGNPLCAEVWFNEMRLTGFDENSGYAALGRLDFKLADLGSITFSGNMHTMGFGSVEQKISQRFRDDFYQYDISGNFELGKFIPKSIGLRLPMYLGITRSFSNPQFDPYQLDVRLKDVLNVMPENERAAYKRTTQDYTSIRSFNLTNIRRVNPKKGAVPHFYSLENLFFTYAYTQTFRSTPIIESDITDRYHVEGNYAFPGKSKFFMPFEKMLSKSKNKYLKPIKDFNFNLMPTNIAIKTQYDRQLGQTQLRARYPGDIVEPTYAKFFTTDRSYAFKYDITKGLNLDFNAVNNARIDEPAGAIDTDEKRDSINTNLKKFGRNTHYKQTANFSYAAPLNKIPLLDWTSLNVKYGTGYEWTAAPQVLDTTFDSNGNISKIRQVDNPIGNTINNQRNFALNGDLNIRNLYGKWKWLKRFDTNFMPGKTPPGGGKTQNEPKKVDEDANKLKNNQSAPPKSSPAVFALRLLISLKKINFSYTRNNTTILPGFAFRNNILGQNLDKSAPGYDFIFGYQPDENWLFNAASKGWLSKSPNLNYQFIQTESKTLTARATFEPAKDFIVDLNINRTLNTNSNAFFRNTNTVDDPVFKLLNPQQNGNFTMTFIALPSAFAKFDSGYSKVFNQFADYREIISKRWQLQNPESQGTFVNPYDTTLNNGNFAYGYGPYSQDVLVPAFIAAYSGKDPNKVSLRSIFKAIPSPNWKVTYNGISKFKWAKKYFNNFSISHGYTSTISVGTFLSSIEYQGTSQNGYLIPNVIDQSSGNFVTYYDIPGISISERFSPLIGIDMSWRIGLTTKFEYSQGRNMQMSFLNYQLNETRSRDITLNMGYKWKNAPIPFKIRGKKQRLKNVINCNMQFGVNSNNTSAFRLDSALPALPTAGNTTIQINPSFDYQVNNRLNIKLFFDRRYTIPATSASFPITYTNAGLTVRFTLQ
jgi:cell surface protein SprA